MTTEQIAKNLLLGKTCVTCYFRRHIIGEPSYICQVFTMSDKELAEENTCDKWYTTGGVHR